MKKQINIIHYKIIDQNQNHFLLLKHLDRDHKVLDIGCKYGDKSYLISQEVNQVIAIDMDNSAINIANSNYSR